MKASLLLEDGTYFEAEALGASTEAVGELVFNTAMTGYEEVLSDPSYLGQTVVFTTSYIGNTGITRQDMESPRMYAEALICKNICRTPDNYRSVLSLEDFLRAQGKMALYGLDTRFLTQHVRDKGCLMSICSTLDHDPQSLLRKLKQAATLHTTNQTALYQFQKDRVLPAAKKASYRVAVVDFGIKNGILNDLQKRGCEVVLFPYGVRAEDIQAIQPDGLFFSNGPGDPRVLAADSSILSVITQLAPQYPTFGICLGHQLLALAFQGRIDKLLYGHHAVNHPVIAIDGVSKPPVMITSQNHNYVVEMTPALAEQFVVTHRHLNDNTVAGMRHKSLPLFSVQFHPESNPGPHDAGHFFDEFISAMSLKKGPKNPL